MQHSALLSVIVLTFDPTTEQAMTCSVTGCESDPWVDDLARDMAHTAEAHQIDTMRNEVTHKGLDATFRVEQALLPSGRREIVVAVYKRSDAIAKSLVRMLVRAWGGLEYPANPSTAPEVAAL